MVWASIVPDVISYDLTADGQVIPARDDTAPVRTLHFPTFLHLQLYLSVSLTIILFITSIQFAVQDLTSVFTHR